MALPQPRSTPSTDFVSIGRRVLTAEAEALEVLAAGLNDSFAKAVQLMIEASGRVVISGMGKSGHIGRKIAATLASTGTPAIFVHPGEASHGDLGMVTTDDVVIAISNSGETRELADMIAYTRRYQLPLIGITKGSQSALAKAADVLLLLPDEPETCPMGLTPTTSTTMTLALGDALAVAALEHRGFTAHDFRNFHPGGKLGSQLTRVAQIMHGVDELPLVLPEVEMADALMVMSDKGFGCVGVIDSMGALVGIFTDGDLRRHISGTLLAQPINSVMSPAPQTIAPDALAAEAVYLLNHKKRTQLFVVNESNQPIGLIHLHDLLRIGVA